MLIWCGLLFFLGLMAFVDSVFNMGEIFRQVNSVLFLLVSMALFVRTSTKSRAKKIEKLQSQVFDLELEVGKLKKERERQAKF